MNLGTAQIIRGDARHLPLADNSVDLVVTSPPYFALRSYQDGGEHYEGQIGSEPTPAEFVAALLEVTAECVRVLKPSGSLWVNLGDKYSGAPSGPQGASGGLAATGYGDRVGGRRRVRHAVPNKSLIGIPWRYALACIDDLGLILRAEVIWSKPNGLPESVTDRVRRSHEQWFHFTLAPRYFSAVDEIREQYEAPTATRTSGKSMQAGVRVYRDPSQPRDAPDTMNPLGKLPGSVWTVATEPLRVPEAVSHALCCEGSPMRDDMGRIECPDGIDHFAAFPSEWPKRIIQGWSPAGVCVDCGEGRRPTLHKVSTPTQGPNRVVAICEDRNDGGRPDGRPRTDVTITGYSCACPEPTADTTPAVVLDPFGGTGTTALVAKALGRHGISVDMSADYCRLATWRTNDRDQLAKVLGVAKAEQQPDDQLSMLDLLDGGAA